MIHEEQFPRVCQELQECLHPTIETYVGDWILYNDYTIIRVYGLEISPYKLPTFLTPRIFSLEVLRQRFNSDYIHFSKQNRATSFKMPITIGSLRVNNRSTTRLIEDILTYFGFEQMFHVIMIQSR